MYITKMYKYEKNGIVYVAGVVPEDSTLLETLNILNAEKGYELFRISDNQNVGANIWLKNEDTEENYKEKKREKQNANK